MIHLQVCHHLRGIVATPLASEAGISRKNISHMAEALRRSNRKITVKKDLNFEYDEDVLKALTGSVHKREVWHQRTASLETGLCNIPASDLNDVQCFSAKSLTECSELEIVNNSIGNIESVSLSSEVFINELQVISPYRHLPTDSASQRAAASNVNIETGGRKKSSTRLDFLDLQGNFLSVDNICDMSHSESEDTGAGAMLGSSALA